jgi:hypothetical protein
MEFKYKITQEEKNRLREDLFKFLDKLHEMYRDKDEKKDEILLDKKYIKTYKHEYYLKNKEKYRLRNKELNKKWNTINNKKNRERKKIETPS